MDLTEDEIITQYGPVLYNSPNAATRSRIQNIEEVPIIDGRGREKFIYTPEGERVVRRYPDIRHEDVKHCGILIDFDKCRELFIEPEIIDVDASDNECDFPMDVDDDVDGLGFNNDTARSRYSKHDTTFRTYPAAFTHHIGHIQADGPIIPLKHKIYAINRGTRLRPGIGTVIVCGPQQIYNYYTQYLRRSKSMRIAQRGVLTGASAGAYAHNPATQTTASEIYKAVSAPLPHTAIDDEMNDEKKSFLRSENVFTINVFRLKDDIRNGGDFFGSVIKPLLDACTHPDICVALKKSSVIFKPEVCLCHSLLSPICRVVSFCR